MKNKCRVQKNIAKESGAKKCIGIISRPLRKTRGKKPIGAEKTIWKQSSIEMRGLT